MLCRTSTPGRCASALLLALAVAGAAARPSAAAELAPRVASYAIDVTLDADARALSGTAVLRWRNPSRTPVDELYLHLYLNAFANNRTSLMTGMREEAEKFLSRHADPWGR